MGSCREILTLQLGSYANLVGTHWWNIQESTFEYEPNKKSDYCHDVLFREGLTLHRQVTFTPRVICVDRASKLPPVPILEDPVADATVLWDSDKLERVEKKTEEVHPFIQDLEAGVDVSEKEYLFEETTRGWSDLLRTRLHPRSLLLGYEEKEQEEFEDRIRAYVEECDNIQGFQLLLDATDSFPELLSYLSDEYPSKCTVIFPLLACTSGERRWKDVATKAVRTVISYHDSAESATLTAPLSCVSHLSLKEELFQTFPELYYTPESSYQTSAILASFLDTFTLPYRLQNDYTRMSDVVSSLTSRGWKFSAASLSLPFPKKPSLSLMESLEARDDETLLWSSLTPNASVEDSWYQNMTFRGLEEGKVLLEYLRYLSSSSSVVSSTLVPLTTLPPYPRFFSSHVSCKGSVDPTASRAAGFQVLSCPVLAGLHACPGVGNMLQHMTSLGRSIDIRRMAELELEMDTWEEVLETMRTLARNHSVTMDID